MSYSLKVATVSYISHVGIITLFEFFAPIFVVRKLMDGYEVTSGLMK